MLGPHDTWKCGDHSRGQGFRDGALLPQYDTLQVSHITNANGVQVNVAHLMGMEIELLC
jgi:hypothetical protein